MLFIETNYNVNESQIDKQTQIVSFEYEIVKLIAKCGEN